MPKKFRIYLASVEHRHFFGRSRYLCESELNIDFLGPRSVPDDVEQDGRSEETVLSLSGK